MDAILKELATKDKQLATALFENWFDSMKNSNEKVTRLDIEARYGVTLESINDLAMELGAKSNIFKIKDDFGKEEVVKAMLKIMKLAY